MLKKSGTTTSITIIKTCTTQKQLKIRPYDMDATTGLSLPEEYHIIRTGEPNLHKICPSKVYGHPDTTFDQTWVKTVLARVWI